MTDQEWQRQARLDCTLARFETVAAAAGRAGLFSGRVALARQTAARARREHEGGLPADAAHAAAQTSDPQAPPHPRHGTA